MAVDKNSEFFKILKHVYPDMSDDELMAKAGSAPEDAKSEIINNIHPGDDITASDNLTNGPTFPNLNSTPSSYDVNVSDNTVTQNGKVDSQVPENLPKPAYVSEGLPEMPPKMPDVTAPMPAAEPAPSTPAPMTSKPASDPLDAITSNDKTARDAEMERERKNHKLGAFAVAGGGIADALGNAASAFGGKGSTTAAEDALKGITDTETRDKARFEDKLKNDPNSDVSKSYRQMVLQIAPDMAKHPAFNSMTAAAIGDKLPLIDTMMKSQASKDAREISLKQIQSNKALMLEQQRQNHENAAVNQGIGRLAGIRGDASLARAEVQRDAAATAVNRIDEVLATGQALSPFDYTDILGQLYKARSGNGAGEQVMKEIRQPVGSAAFNKAWTYITGMQAPGTSKDISKSLREAAYSMGKQADEFHDGYMKTHLIKPAGVSDDAWSSVASTSRGSSFADNVALHQEALKKSRQSNGGSSARPAKDPGGFF